eukprot:926972-Pyramimonas_sp.AAC.1
MCIRDRGPVSDARQLASSSQCPSCQSAPGTPFHRVFCCDAFEVERWSALDPAVRQVAARLGSWGQELDVA